jgi:uncharacterized protein (DUF3084 family)
VTVASLAELAVQGIITVGGGGAVLAGINGYFSRRVTKATVVKTIAETGRTEAEIVGVGASTASQQVDTAMDMLREMRTDLTSVRTELTATRLEHAATRTELTSALRQIDTLQRWKADHEARMGEHAVWDAEMVDQVRDLGGHIRSAPPLGIGPIGLMLPPEKHYRDGHWQGDAPDEHTD